jgi:Xaa-Pro aminopeptidase
VAYAVITLEEAYLFIDSCKVIDPLVLAHLSSGGITCHRYDDIEIFLNKQSSKGKVMIDPVQLNWQLYLAIKGSSKGENMVESVSPLTLQKSVKNKPELDGMRASHVRDGAALTAFLCWLETTMKNDDAKITEYDVSVKIEEFRGQAKVCS